MAKKCAAKRGAQTTTFTGPDKYGSMYFWVRPELRGVRGCSAFQLTSTHHNVEVILDYDKAGKIIGVELLNVPERWVR